MPASRCILRTTRALLTEKRKRPSSSTRRGSGIWEHWLTALNWRDFEAGIWWYTYTDGTKARAPTNNRRGRRPQLDASTNWTIPQGYKRREPRSRSSLEQGTRKPNARVPNLTSKARNLRRGRRIVYLLTHPHGFLPMDGNFFFLSKLIERNS